ncbi:MAG: hypothetical protein ABI655_10720, partial [Phenylobacterium sp.]
VQSAANNVVVYGGDFTITATHTADIFGVADSTQASALGYSGANVTNTVAGTTTAAVGDDHDLNGSNMTMEAYTSTVMDGDSPSVIGGAGGAANGAAVASTTTIDDVTAVTLGYTSSLTANGDASGPGLVSLLAHNNIQAADTVKLVSGGLAEAASASSSIAATFSNEITLADFAGLYSGGKIQVGTYSLSDLSSSAAVKTYGLAGVVDGYTNAALVGDQTITFGSEVGMQAGDDIAITAGQSGDGGWVNALRAGANTEAYNYTLIPVPSKSDATATITNNNKLIIGENGIIQGARDITLGAVLGERATSAHATGHNTWDPSFSIVSSSGQTGSTESAALVMDGRAIAGANAVQSLTVDPLGNVTQATSGWLAPTHTVVQNYDPNAVLQAAINALPANDPSGQLQVLQQLQQFVTPDPTGVGIVVGPIFASGGSITINAQTVTTDPGSSGSLTANGGASITIANASASHLVLGPMTIPVEPNAGRVIFTDPALGAPIAGLAVNQVNAGVGTQISVNNTNTAAAAPPQIFLTGPVSNVSGDVTLASAAGSVGLFAGVDARTIEILAPQGDAALICPQICPVAGSVQDNYASSGIRPTDPTAAIQLFANADLYADYLDFVAAGTEGTFYALMVQPGYEFTTFLLTNNTMVSDGTGYSNLFLDLGNAGTGPAGGFFPFGGPAGVAVMPVVPTTVSLATPPAVSGGITAQAISISAQVIDVNGPITAGSLVDSSVVISAAANGPGITTQVANPGDRLIDATYDAANNRVVIEDTSVRGAGSIYLNGQIVSSNPAGSLTVQSGESNATITNASGLPLLVRDMNAVGGGVGQIQIVDHLKTNGQGAPLTTWYLYTPGSGLAQYDNTNGGTTWQTGVQTLAGGAATASYAPTVGASLQWTETVTLSRQTPLTNVSWDDYTVGPWQFITTNDNPATDLAAGYQFGGVQVVVGAPTNVAYSQTVTATNGSSGGVMQPDAWSSGYTFNMAALGLASMQLTSTAKADYPVALNFQNGAGIFNINSNGAPISLTGRIVNVGGTTAINAAGAAITQTVAASIQSGSLSLQASGGVGTLVQPIVAELTGGTLSATTIGGNVNVASRTGSLSLADVAALNFSGQPIGDVNIAAAGSILMGAAPSAAAVSGHNITLTAGVSGAGGLGASDTPLTVQLANGAGQAAGALNAGAVGSIYLTQPTGDLIVDQVSSSAGDVVITTLGGDVLNGNAVAVDPVTEANIDRLAASLNLDSDSGQQAITAYNNSVVRAYNEYWTIRQQFANPGSATFNITGHEARFAARVGNSDPAVIAAAMQSIYNADAAQLAGRNVGLTAYQQGFSYQIPTT